MKRRITIIGLTLLFLSASAPSVGQQSGSPSTSQQPNAAVSGESSKVPATPSLKDYCREHTC